MSAELPPSVVVGRSPECAVCVDHPSVSGRHARIDLGGAAARIVDLTSTNGTFVNGERITEHIMRTGDVVRVGDVETWFDGRTLIEGEPPADPRTVVVGTGKRHERPPTSDLGPRSIVIPAAARQTIGRDPSCTVHLDEPTVSRIHATVVTGAAGSRIEDAGSANGTYVNGERVSKRSLAGGDLIKIGPFSLRFRDGQVQLLDSHPEGFRIEVDDLVVRAGKTPLLAGISLAIDPNELVAIIGGSGSGKTTLLRTILGLREAAEGTVRYNGEPLAQALDAYRPVIGYVPQHDILHRSLPVRRALEYAARLRLPSDLSAADRRAQIDRVLAEVDMTAHASKRIDRLSGGQQKRVSIAAELLSNPRVLILDEPTSGLDDGLDQLLMRLFRRIADEGRTVILVTHNTANLPLADRICILAPGGRQAFVGRAVDAPTHFGVATLADCYQAIAADPDAAIERFERPAPGDERMLPAAERPATRPTSWGSQLRVLMRRNVDVLLRDRRNLLLLLLQAPVIGALLALVIPATAWSDSTVLGARSEQGAFVICVVAVWFGLINAAREISKERPLLSRERMAGLRISPYVLAKFIPLVCLSVVQCAILLAIVVARAGSPPHALVFGGNPDALVGLVLASAGGIACALVISAVASNDDRAMSFVPYVLIPQFLLAGVAFRLGDQASWLSRLTFTRWSTETVGSGVRVCDHLGVDGAPGCDRTMRHLDYSLGTLGTLGNWAVLAAFSGVLVWLAGYVLSRSRLGDR